MEPLSANRPVTFRLVTIVWAVIFSLGPVAIFAASVHTRVTTLERSEQRLFEDLKEIKQDVKELLRRTK